MVMPREVGRPGRRSASIGHQVAPKQAKQMLPRKGLGSGGWRFGAQGVSWKTAVMDCDPAQMSRPVLTRVLPRNRTNRT